MSIEKNSVVSFHYRLSVGGEQVEDSHNGEPLAYLHGHGNIIPGLEHEMAGKSAGERFTATIAPEMAYGQRREDAITYTDETIPVMNGNGYLESVNYVDKHVQPSTSELTTFLTEFYGRFQ